MKLPSLFRSRSKAAGTLIAGAVATTLAVTSIGPEEGKRNVAYQDIVKVWTVCYGTTKGVKKGDRYTDAECNTMFVEDLKRHELGMRGCLKAPDGIPVKSYVAFLDLTYNVGVGGFCKSSVARKVNDGDLVGACRAMSAFNKAGGVANKGLTGRRARKVAMCLEGAAV